MKTKEELRAYFDEFKRHNIRLPNVITFKQNISMHLTITACRGNFRPWEAEMIDNDWLNYWRVFANSNEHGFSLSEYPEECSCKKDFNNEEQNSHDDNMSYALVLISNDMCEYLDGIYIIPVCSICSQKYGERLLYVKQGTKLVEMLWVDNECS